MKVVRSPEQLRPEVSGAVVALGVFDGVHRGHQAVLTHVVTRARELAVASAVVTFDVHPDQVLHGREAGFLTSLEHRLRLIGGFGIAGALVLQFDETLASMSARDFARWVFREGFGARTVVMGQSSTFGRGGEGTPQTLARWGEPWGLDVEVVEPVLAAGEPISSTRIREAVRHGDLEGAAALLGRPFSVLGTVVPGEGRGRRLGFPTANLDLHHEACPGDGVYVARANVGGEWRPAVVSVGHRPTFNLQPAPVDEPAVEVHLLDFEDELLGQTLEVQFLNRLREQKRFAGAEALAAQIGRDVAAARVFFQRRPQSKQPEQEEP